MENTSNQVNDIIQEFSINPLLWGKIYLTQHFRIKSPTFHFKILKLALTNTFLAVAAPRGSAKSTILSFLYPLHCVMFKKKRFIIIVSNTYAKAARSLENIKKELRDNQMLSNDYPIIITKDAEGDSIFRHSDGFETRVLCKGADQIGSVRGEKFGAYRPDLILVDDVEDDEMVRSQERRIQLRSDFDEALKYSGDIVNGTYNTQFIIIGTILHDDSLMAKLVSPKEYTHFKKLRYKGRITNPDGTYSSLWNDKWTVEFLNQLEKEDPNGFAKEIQNDPASGANQIFLKEDFRYWHIDNDKYVLFGENNKIESIGSLKDCKGAMACDLAWSEKRTADDNVIMAGLLTPSYDFLIYTYLAEKGLRPDTLNEYIFNLHSKLSSLTGGYVPLGMEKAMREKVAKWDLEREMRKRNHWIDIKVIQWESDKIKRITSALLSRYKQHTIFHRKDMGDLENQLTRFPTATHDDIVDAEHILSKMFEYAKVPRKPADHDDAFEWYRKLAIERNNPKITRYNFGSKGKQRASIPSRIAYR